MDDQRRSLLAAVLIFGFFYVWLNYFVPRPQPAPPTGSGAPSVAAEVASASASPTPAAVPTQVAALPQPEKRTTLQTALMDVALSSHSGTVTDVTLHKFRTALSKDSPSIPVVPLREKARAPLAWSYDVDGVEISDRDASFEVSSQDTTRVEYRRTLRPGLELRKSFLLEEGQYPIEHIVEVRNAGTEAVKVTARTAMNVSGALAHKSSFTNPGDPLRALAYVGEKARHWTGEDVAKAAEVPKGDIAWAGFDTRYFLLALVPEEGRFAELKWSATNAGDDLEGTLLYPPREIAPGQTARYSLKLFAGPKDIGVLQAAGGALERAIDLGDWLGPIARALLRFLRWLYSFVPNYGIAIILLTATVRLAMFPLAQKQAKSMKRMQHHKPQMDALKEKYKDDKETYSRELMTYMRSHKINPMGGCLLLLPQLPIFFALYRVLYNSIELRHAPFMLWIKDLSAHDPWFVTPVLLAIVMFIQQQMTPTPGMDPAQQKMMKIMPVMFSVFMLFLPAGLNLYIFVSTLWGIAQQAWVQRGTKTVAAVKI